MCLGSCCSKFCMKQLMFYLPASMLLAQLEKGVATSATVSLQNSDSRTPRKDKEPTILLKTGAAGIILAEPGWMDQRPPRHAEGSLRPVKNESRPQVPRPPPAPGL